MGIKNNKDAYQAWLNNHDLSIDSMSFHLNVSESLLAAEPDLAAVEEPYVSDELQAAIEAIQDGALKDLSATQQQIFQLSIVEGAKDKDVMAALQLDKQAFKYHMKEIGFKLRKRCNQKLRGL